LSCRLRFTSSRRSTPSCIMVNRGWGSPSTPGSRRDGCITCLDGSGLGLWAVDGEKSRLGDIGGDARPSGERSSFAPQSPSSSPSPFSSSTSVEATCCCSCKCAVGGAGEPVNNNASSSAAKAKTRENARNKEESNFFNLDHLDDDGCRYAPSSKKYTRVLSPRM
jgi:hypothetical protein